MDFRRWRNGHSLQKDDGNGLELMDQRDEE